MRAKRLDQKHSDDYLGQGCWACRDVSEETINFFVKRSPFSQHFAVKDVNYYIVDGR